MEEQRNGADTVIMAVLYTPTALTVSLSIMGLGLAYALWESSYRHWEDFELGYDSKPSSKGGEH